MAPALMPRPWDGSQRFALFEPATVFLNAAAFQALGLSLTELPQVTIYGP